MMGDATEEDIEPLSISYTINPMQEEEKRLDQHLHKLNGLLKTLLHKFRTPATQFNNGTIISIGDTTLKSWPFMQTENNMKVRSIKSMFTSSNPEARIPEQKDFKFVNGSKAFSRYNIELTNCYIWITPIALVLFVAVLVFIVCKKRNANKSLTYNFTKGALKPVRPYPYERQSLLCIQCQQQTENSTHQRKNKATTPKRVLMNPSTRQQRKTRVKISTTPATFTDKPAETAHKYMEDKWFEDPGNQMKVYHPLPIKYGQEEQQQETFNTRQELPECVSENESSDSESVAEINSYICERLDEAEASSAKNSYNTGLKNIKRVPWYHHNQTNEPMHHASCPCSCHYDQDDD